MTIRILACAALLFAACGTPAPSPVSTPVTYDAEITLLKPDTVGGLTINEALYNRRSWREYNAESLSLEELSGVLWAAAGVNRPADPADSTAADRLTSPSALALYPIRVYAFLPGGIYLYDAAALRLRRVAEGDHRAVAGAQPFVATAPLNLAYVADLAAYEDRNIPDEQVRYLCGQDAAGCAENVNLYTAGHELRSITRGSASPNIIQALGLDTARYVFALAQSVGK